MSWPVRILRSSIGKKISMAATGFLLTLFLLVHLAGNATIFLGREAFLSYADHLHALGAFLVVAEAALVLVFLIHIVLAVLLTIENFSSRPSRYAVNKSEGGRSPGSRTMPYTGAWIFVFLIVHKMNFSWSASGAPIADTVRDVLTAPGYAVFYMLSMVAVALHVSHGFWSMFQTLGINHPKYNPFLRFCALAVSVTAGTVFFLIPAMALFYGHFLL